MSFSRRRLIGGVAVASVIGAGVYARVALTRGPYDAASCPRFLPAGNPDALGPIGPAPAAATTGRLLISHDRSGDASIVDLTTGQATYVEVGFTDPHEVAISSDGRWGIMSDYGDRSSTGFDGNRVAVIDMAAKRLVRTIDLGPNRGAHGVAFVAGTPRALVTTQSSRTIVEVDVERGTVLGTMDTRADGSHLLTLAPDTRTVFSVNEGNGSITRIDLPTRSFVSQHVLGPSPSEGIAITPDGRHLWVGTKVGGRVRIVDAATGAVIDSISGFRYPDRIAITADGQRALIIDEACTHIADVATRKVIADIVGYTGTFGLSQDGRVAFFPGRADGVVLIDAQSGRVIGRHELRHWAHGIAWGPAP